jgi:hypothetical protein
LIRKSSLPNLEEVRSSDKEPTKDVMISTSSKSVFSSPPSSCTTGFIRANFGELSVAGNGVLQCWEWVLILRVAQTVKELKESRELCSLQPYLVNVESFRTQQKKMRYGFEPMTSKKVFEAGQSALILIIYKVTARTDWQIHHKFTWFLHRIS